MRPHTSRLWLTTISICGTLGAAISAHAISMEKDRRVVPGDSARGQLSATGLVRCGAATGTAQLTVRNDVITTAAHVLIDQYGKHRIGCVFEPTMAGGGPIPIDFDSIRTGSKMPLTERATRDWAVARLVAPVKGAAPYGIGYASTSPLSVFMCAGGNRAHAAMGTENCSTRRVIGTASDGIRELAIDCNAGPGSSGAALVAENKIVGIYVGYRSSDPGKARAYSDEHYNFAITIDGPFRRELLAAAHR
jgi:V8-like Glu-specific endopeptidase